MSHSESIQPKLNTRNARRPSSNIISRLVSTRSIRLPDQRFETSEASGTNTYRIETAKGDPVISRIIKLSAMKYIQAPRFEIPTLTSSSAEVFRNEFKSITPSIFDHFRNAKKSHPQERILGDEILIVVPPLFVRTSPHEPYSVLPNESDYTSTL